jgi:MarR family transcriptional regulator, organic hydroperoxide resistance regulator
VRDVHRAFTRSLQDRISLHGVTMGQWFFLRALWEENGLTQRELSQRVGMMEPTTVTALNSMERRGLVERVRNKTDRRKVNIFLTEKGLRLEEVLQPAARMVNLEAVRGLSPEVVQLVMGALATMLVNLTPADEDGAFGPEDDAG